jgi:hypothetical protein
LTLGKAVRVNPTWAASLDRKLRETRQALQEHDPAEMARRSGATREIVAGERRLEVRFWDRVHLISWPDLTVQGEEGRPCGELIQAALLDYLLLADGAPIEDVWVSFRNLPRGSFYEQAYQSYSGNMLARTFRGNLEGFRATARRLGGEPLDMGDAAYRFWALPRIPLAVVFWSGGEEFPDSAQVLFDRSASHYHCLEMLAHLGAMLCERLARAREKPDQAPASQESAYRNG